jgi:tetratricopeptide (TPR) repeat protein
MSPCPSTQCILDYLEGRLGEVDGQQLEQHVEDCSSCQQAMAQLSGPALLPHRDTVPHAGPAADPDNLAPLLPGCLFSGEVKFGGMGVVYFGTESALRRPVAVKVLRQHLAHRPEMVARFEAEAQVCAQLQHPGIVPVYQVGRLADGRPYYAMKLVKGDTLADLLKRRVSPSADLLGMLGHFRRVCEAMAYAHAHNVLHRDLKPANVMVGAYGEVLLMDWGLAKVLGESSTEVLAPEPPSRAIDIGGDGTRAPTAGALGTIAYMPPEQASGLLEEVDKRSDVFGLGAILCAILTGRPPYVGPSEDYVLRQAMRGDLSDASDRLNRCGADEELVTLTRRCLSPSRPDRPTDAGFVAKAITDYLARVQERLREAELERKTVEVRAVEERKRRRVWLGLAAALLALVAVVSLGAWWLDRSAATARHERETREARTRDSVDSLFEQLDRALEAGQIEQAEGPLGLIRKRMEDMEAGDLRERLERAEKNLAMIRKLDLLFDRRWQVVQSGFLEQVLFGRTQMPITPRLARTEEQFDLRAVDREFRSAFEAYGLAVGELASDATVGLVRTSRIQRPLVDGLMQWFLLAPQTPGLRDLLDRLDHDSTRRAARQSLASRRVPFRYDKARLAQLAEEPPSTILLLAELVEGQKAIDLLRRAVEFRPDEYRLHVVLVHRLLSLRFPPSELAITHARIAHALRRASTSGILLVSALTSGKQYDEAFRCGFRSVERASDRSVAALARTALGNVYRAMGKHDAAIEQFRLAVELNPGHSGPHSHLGVTYRSKKEYGQAIHWLRKAVALDPRDFTTHRTLGWAYQDNREYDRAIASLLKAIELEPRSTLNYCSLADVYRDRKEYSTAIHWARKATTIDPTDAYALRTLGQLQFENNQHDDAIKHFRKAIAADPRYAYACTSLAAVYRKRKEYDQAIEWVNRAIALTPNDGYAHCQLADIHRDRKEYDRALECYRKALAVDPGYHFALSSMASTFREMKDYPQALEWMKKAQIMDPKSAYLCCSLGDCYAAMGDHAEAVRWMKKGLAQDPRYAYGHVALGGLYVRLERYDEAINCFQKAITIDPRNANTHMSLAGTYLTKKDIGGAVEHARKAGELDSNYAPMSHLILGAAHMLKQEFAEAIRCLEKAIELDPRHARAYLLLGQIHQEQKAYGKAITAFEKTIAIDPGYATAHQSLGMLRSSAGDYDWAIAHLKKAIALDPNQALIHTNLGEVWTRKRTYDQAIRHLHRAIELDSNQGHAYYLLGYIHLARKEVAAAIPLLQKAIKLGHHGAHVSLGHTHLAKKEHDEAIGCFRWAIRLNPSGIEGHNGLITALAAAKKCRDSIAAVETARRALPGESWPLLRYNAACTYALAGCGQGDAAGLELAERARLRKQALACLRDEMKRWTQLANSSVPASRMAATALLQHVLKDEDFAGVRDPRALNDLEAEERTPWQQFWTEVKDLLARTEPSVKK